MAKKNQLNVSVGVDTKGYKKSWEEAISITQGSGKDIEKEADKMARAVSKKLEGMSVKSQARQLENLVIKMQEAGMAGTKAFTMAATSAGKLKAEIDDAKGIIAAMRPDAPFNALNTTLGASAQAFAGVQGAMALFGGESENVQKTLLKVQAAMAFAEGFKALDGLSDGFQQLNLVIKANPLIAGAVAFAAATAVIVAMSSATTELEVKQKALLDISNKAFDATIAEKTELKRLLDVYNDKNTTDTKRLKIQKTLVEKYPEYLGQISTEKVEQGKVNGGIVSYIKLLDIKAKAQAAQELYVEALKEERRLIQQYAKDQMQMPNNPFAKFLLEETGISKGNEQLAAMVNKVSSLKKEYEQLSQAAYDAAGAQSENFGDKFGKPKNTPKAKLATPIAEVNKMAAADDFANIADGVWNATTGATEYKSAVDEAIKGTDQLKSSNEQLATTFHHDVVTSLMATKGAIKEAATEVKDFAELTNTINESIKRLAVDSIQSFSMAMGEMIAGSGTAMQDFGTQLLKSIAAFMQTVSQAMIATAIASDLFQKTLFTQPEIALAAGVALAIGAGIVKQTMSGGVEGKGFAEGGLIGGNSYSGDKLFAPVNSGEVILNTGQQNQLLRMANGGGGSGSLMTSFSRNEFIIWLDKGGSDRRR